MSLDVYLNVAEPVKLLRESSGIFVREGGARREISREEWDLKNPGREPVVCAADVSETTTEVYSANITHNLGGMAKEAGIYQHLWRPEEIGITKAGQLISPLKAALVLMKANPLRFSKHNAANGWGTYEQFVPFVEDYYAACETWPDAEIRVSR